MSKKKKKLPLESQDFSINPFASLDIKCEASDPEPIKKAAKIQHTSCSIRLEKKGRAGKQVTVLYSFEPVLELVEMMNLLSDIKKAIGSGGTVKEETLELQGDKRQQAADFLTKKNFRVKGALN
jgi:translation initiation factor 1